MRPRTRRTTTTRRTNPTPPVGAYPQLLLCDHRGSTPRSARIKTTINIVPSMSCSFSQSSDREISSSPGAPSRESAPCATLHRNADRYSDVGITAVVHVIAVVDVGDVNVVIVIPVIPPIFWPRINKTYPIALILEAWVPTHDQEGQAINAKPVVTTEVSAVTVVRDAVAVISATLLPVTVVRVPAL